MIRIIPCIILLDINLQAEFFRMDIEKQMILLNGKTYIIMTKNEGIVYKRLNKNNKIIKKNY